LVGTYTLQTKDGKASLKLLPDGKLEQRVEPIQGAARTVIGKWEWDQKAGNLILKDAIDIDGDHIGLRADVIMMPVVRTFLGSVKVQCDQDLECAYHKQ
jgi:hypothetical protein